MANPFKGMNPGNAGGAGMLQMLQQVQKKMREDGEKMQERLDAARIDGSSGGGAVRVVVDGHGMPLELNIKPEAVDPADVEMLQDLILTAFREALEKSEDLRTEEQQKLMPNIPGLNLPGLF